MRRDLAIKTLDVMVKEVGTSFGVGAWETLRKEMLATPIPCDCINRFIIGNVSGIHYSWCRDCGTLFQSDASGSSPHKPKRLLVI